MFPKLQIMFSKKEWVSFQSFKQKKKRKNKLNKLNEDMQNAKQCSNLAKPSNSGGESGPRRRFSSATCGFFPACNL